MGFNEQLAPPFQSLVTPPARTIKAIIDRAGDSDLPAPLRGNSASLVIRVANDPVKGICTAATAPAAANEFDAAIISQTNAFLETFGEEIIYHPISAEGLDMGGGDSVEIAVRLGQTKEKRKVVQLLGQDAGMLKLEVR